MSVIEVSIIIPCYNAEKTIYRTLNSLLSQTFRNFEVIIINDGSKDNSEKKIAEYIKKYTSMKIRYFYQENRGVSVARNEGLKKANGKYITFLDADDLYHPRFLEILHKLLIEKKADIVCCQYKKISSEKNFIVDVKNIENKKLLPKEEILRKYIHKRKTRFSFVCAIYKRSIIEKENLCFPINIRFGEDSEFICKYLTHCDKGIFLNECLYGYLNNNQSVMHSKCDWRRTDNLTATKNIIDYWNRNDLNIDFSEYMLSRAVWACAKDFANEDELFVRLKNKYDLIHAMKVMVKHGDELLIRISAIIFLVNERLYKILMSGYIKYLNR